MNDADEVRLWRKVKVCPQTDCWEWTGALFDSGYGAFQVDGKSRRAHRVAWERSFGEIGTGLVVCHRCDNPKCINPAHLFLGTPLDNRRDCVAKGRQARGERSARYTHPETTARGERHGRARLSGEAVRQIRSRHATGLVTAKALAHEFGVGLTTVWHVIHGDTWKSA